VARKRFAAVLCALAVSAALPSGCADNGDSLTGDDGSGNITVLVGGGTTPTYSWSGAGVFSLSVARTSDPVTPVWGFLTPGTDGITSPVTHGTVPAGAVATAMTENALTTGVEYRVLVQRINGSDFGQTDFTP